MDKHWARMRNEVPQVKRPPSEYLRTHFWFTTQPIEEPDHPQHLADIISWLGWDRLMFSSDYPHWDFDDPQQVFKFRLSEAEQAMVFRDNAKKVYGLVTTASPAPMPSAMRASSSASVPEETPMPWRHWQ